jgi:hypothetical protein
MSEYCLQAPALECKIAGCLLLPLKKNSLRTFRSNLEEELAMADRFDFVSKSCIFFCDGLL